MRKTKLATAVSLALVGSAGVIDSAQAVNVNPDNLGEVLLYPYYTVRNGTDTLISITNTRNQVKAVKVRIMEGKNSQEVLDFNLYLSPYDVWTGSIVKTEAGAELRTSDESCTVPPIPEEGVEFRNTRYTGELEDGEDTSLDRTREGHIEIIEMGVVTDGAGGDGFAPASAATHVSGEPRDCSVLVEAWTSGGVWAGSTTNSINPDPESLGGLLGGAVLINVTQGTDYSYTATALDDFFNQPIHTSPGNILPNLTRAFPISHIFTGDGVLTSSWGAGNGEDAVSAVLMHDSIINTYVTSAAINAGTDWVVTFPTKRYYTDIANPADRSGVDPAEPPFTENFWTGGACERVGLEVWNREEEAPVGEVDFSPLPPSGTNTLCWEVNVITFNETSVLDSELELNVNTLSVGENGWMKLTLSGNGHQMTDLAGVTYFGLPTIGFAVQQYVNGDVDGVLSNYGGLFEHAGTQPFSGAAAQQD